jgi:PAS domain S-box-containing protein
MAARTESEDVSEAAPQGVLAASPSVTTALKHAPMGIAIFDDQMRYLAASRQYLTDQGMSPDTPLLGRHHYDVFPEIPQFWRDKHAQVLAQGVELRDDDGERYVDRDGGVHWVRWSMAPWRTDDGRIGGLVLYTEMVTAAVAGPPSAAGRRGPLPRGVRPGGHGRGPGVGQRPVPGGQRQASAPSSAATARPCWPPPSWTSRRDPEDNVATVVTQGQALLAGEIDSYTVERRIDRPRRRPCAWIHLSPPRGSIRATAGPTWW